MTLRETLKVKLTAAFYGEPGDGTTFEERKWNAVDAAIAEVLRFAERLAVQGSEHDPAVGIRIDFVAALKRKAWEK